LESEQSTSNSAIWGLGKYSVASTFVQQLPAAAINDVKGYFVYMTNATRHYQPITAQAAQMAQRNCTDSLASIQKEPQRVLSPLGLVALVEPDNDLQVQFIFYLLYIRS
jgi:hypothetical protein